MWDVSYKVLKLKVEIGLAFFLTLILFSLDTIGNKFCRNSEYLTDWIKEVFVMKTFWTKKN